MIITYSMRNVTSELARRVMLRKHFQMVFIGNDNKSINICTATIIGASNACPESTSQNNQDTPPLNNISEKYDENFISDFANLKQFRMRFEIAVGSIDDNEVVAISHKDITNNSEQENGFLNEIDCIRNVWGKKCEIITNNQPELLKKYKEIHTIDPENENEITRLTADLSKHYILWTEQQKNFRNDKDMKSLSIAGEFEDIAEPQIKKERDEIAMRRAYTISVPSGVELLPGIELINWVRTTIRFKYSIDDTDFNYSIRKDICDVNDSDKCVFISPDFTWYFSPRIKSYIDTKNCFVEIKRRGEQSLELCECPLQKNKHVFHRGDKFHNSITQVPNKLTVNFNYWTKIEKIMLRQKYRLTSHDIFPQISDFNTLSEVNIFLDMSDEHNRGNRQFLSGIFLSVVLAFGIDSQRLEDIKYCFAPFNQILPVDLLWVIFLVAFTLTLINKPAKLSLEYRKFKRWRNILLWSSAIWTTIVYGVLRSPELLTFIENNQQIVGWCAGGSGFILILLQILYLSNKNVNAGVRLFDSIFRGELM